MNASLLWPDADETRLYQTRYDMNNFIIEKVITEWMIEYSSDWKTKEK